MYPFTNLFKALFIRNWVYSPTTLVLLILSLMEHFLFLEN